MNQPSVCAVMLTANRPEMANQALEAFRRQTYSGYNTLLVVNSGPGPVFEEAEDLREPCFFGADALTVGELRNLVCKYAADHDDESWKRPEIFVTWDDDDLSHPNRIAEQVALLQSSGADVVGYNRMLFWDTRKRCCNHAWIYTGEILGTSLCYWRETWERTPFRAQGWHNEDFGFVTDVLARGGKVVAVDSIPQEWGKCSKLAFPDGPRMIARIHAGNASNPAYSTLETHPQHWKRASEWDAYCKEVCK